MTPAFALKRMLLNNFPSGDLEAEVANSVDFMVEKLEALTGKQLGSRLTLNKTPGYIEPQSISNQDIKVSPVLPRRPTRRSLIAPVCVRFRRSLPGLVCCCLHTLTMFGCHGQQITVIQILEKTVLSDDVHDEISKCFPEAKVAHLRDGGNFPYLARDSEVNMHLKIHLRQFEGTRFNPMEEAEPQQPSALEEEAAAKAQG